MLQALSLSLSLAGGTASAAEAATAEIAATSEIAAEPSAAGSDAADGSNPQALQVRRLAFCPPRFPNTRILTHT